MSRATASLEQSELLTRPWVIAAHRGFVRLVPVVAGAHLVDGGELSLEHDFVDGTLRRREPAIHGKGAA